MKVIHRCTMISYLLCCWTTASAYEIYGGRYQDPQSAIDQYYQGWEDYDPYHERNTVWLDSYNKQPNTTHYYELKPIINARGSTYQCQTIQSSAVGYPLFRTFGLEIPPERSYILKYRVRWYSGLRSKWYTLGKGDVNQYPGFGYPVRVRANFDDHDFEFMACGQPAYDTYDNGYGDQLHNKELDNAYAEQQLRDDYMQQQVRSYYDYPTVNYQDHGSPTQNPNTVSHKQKKKTLDPNDYGFINGRYKGRVYFENPQSDSPPLKLPNFGENYTSFF